MGIDWREEVERMLIHAGTEGVMQQRLVTRCQAWATAELIKGHLEALWAQNKVQKFTGSVSGLGRPATIWRATDLILKK